MKIGRSLLREIITFPTVIRWKLFCTTDKRKNTTVMSKLGHTLLSVNLFPFPVQNSQIEEYSILVLIFFSFGYLSFLVAEVRKGEGGFSHIYCQCTMVVQT